MGNKTSKPVVRRNKAERLNAQEARAAITQQQKQKVSVFQQDVTDEAIRAIQSSTDLVKSRDAFAQVQQVNQFIEISQTQLDRGGQTLTKADLIAILIALEPSYAAKMDMVTNCTVVDLNTFIRAIIYNPDRYLLPQSPFHGNLEITQQQHMATPRYLAIK